MTFGFWACETNVTRATRSFAGLDKYNSAELLLKQARRCVFDNDFRKGDSILNSVDTTLLSRVGLGLYYLSKGFYNHKVGNANLAIAQIDRATHIISDAGVKEFRADLDLIWGIILKDSGFPFEASSRFYDALNYYQEYKHASEYFFTLLGLAYNLPFKGRYLEKTETFLKNSPQSRCNSMFLHLLAIDKDDFSERQTLFHRALRLNGVFQNTHNEINISIALALNSFVMLYSQHEQQFKGDINKCEKSYWIVASLILTILLFGLFILFVYYRKQTSAKINDLNNKIDIISNRLTEQIFENIDKAKMCSDVAKKEGTPINPGKGNWLEFISLFQIHYPLFEEKLNYIHPDLTTTDVKYSKCFFCGLSNYNISKLMDVSPDAVRKSKKKLQRFFNLKEPGDVTKYLQSVDHGNIS
jgi:cell division protein FtsL